MRRPRRGRLALGAGAGCPAAAAADDRIPGQRASLRRLRRIATLASLPAIAALAPAAPAEASLYVDAESRGGRCSDALPALLARTASTPWCTLERAVAAAPGGETVIVRGGDYPALDVDGSRSRSAPLTFLAAAGEVPDIGGLTIDDSTLLRFEGMRFTGEARVRDGSEGVDLVGNELPGQRVWVTDSARVRLERNHVHDLPGGMPGGAIGIRLLHVSAAVVSGNTIERLAEDGIQVGDVSDTVLEGNAIRAVHPTGRGEHADAIQILGADRLAIRANELRDVEFGLMFTDRAANDVTIENNVISDTEGTGFKAEGEFGMPNLRVVGNTWHDSGAPVSFRVRHAGGLVRNNIFDRVDGLTEQPTVDHNLTGRARFVDAAAGDFDLAPGSPGIDAGSSVGHTPTDRLGRPRNDDPAVADTGTGPISYVDIGAQERQVGTAPGAGAPGGRPARPLRARGLRVRRVRRRGDRVTLLVSFGRPAAARRARVVLARRTTGGARRRVARRLIELDASGGRARVRLRAPIRPGRHRVSVRLGRERGPLGPAATRALRLR